MKQVTSHEISYHVDTIYIACEHFIYHFVTSRHGLSNGNYIKLYIKSVWIPLQEEHVPLLYAALILIRTSKDKLQQSIKSKNV